ncbi:formylglycine-generating enzyme family protein [Actomonas aquatica]|uniref:SUMF1/EgtB/PvdO family nonheme iron enzyme n=1 Tax=Actomonas aquatica TaxID=2866162 RepID=A0ABZ1C6E0_9BACT|nr:SUMF1/EgtB/PvdO family nonheme iron enzyme [Opitutus sp. WL0086]WRQ87297.1 SUMF1/EgtB/PvdO family nonheme iron enzyme [Opitutus sp. WL0086]
MPYVQRKRIRYRVKERLGRPLAVLAGGLVLAAFWLWLSSLGPHMQTDQPKPSRSEKAMMAAQEKSVAQVLARAADLAGDGAVQALMEAKALQEEIVAGPATTQAAVRRLAEIERELAEAQAQVWETAVLRAVADAEAAEEAGRTAEAEERWQEALAAQEEINRSAASAGAKDFGRASRLAKRLAELKAGPLAAEVTAAIAAARQAVAAEDWALALAGYTAARAGQARLNEEYSTTRYADTLQLGRIEKEIASLDAAGVAADAEALASEGDAAMEAGDYVAAAAAYAQARAVQVRLNEEFGRSRFVSAERVEQLEVRRQTAASIPRVAQLHAWEAQIAANLARREVGAARALIAMAAVEVGHLFDELSRSERLDPELRLRLSYLEAQQERLSEVQDAVMERFRPLPGVGELWLLQTEVPQSLYLQVMRTNPSRQMGREYAVDSVNWFEAQQFCQRLGWLLGRRVRLPTEDEFRIAVGGGTQAAALAAALEFSADAKGSRPMAAGEPNAGGFFDLVGNLAEWIEAPEDAGDAEQGALIGGSYLDLPESLARLSKTTVPRSERARHIGFRVVVEMTEREERGAPDLR